MSIPQIIENCRKSSHITLNLSTCTLCNIILQVLAKRLCVVAHATKVRLQRCDGARDVALLSSHSHLAGLNTLELGRVVGESASKILDLLRAQIELVPAVVVRGL